MNEPASTQNDQPNTEPTYGQRFAKLFAALLPAIVCGILARDIFRRNGYESGTAAIAEGCVVAVVGLVMFWLIGAFRKEAKSD